MKCECQFDEIFENYSTFYFYFVNYVQSFYCLGNDFFGTSDLYASDDLCEFARCFLQGGAKAKIQF